MIKDKDADWKIDLHTSNDLIGTNDSNNPDDMPKVGFE
jgi:hypothetical protein